MATPNFGVPSNTMMPGMEGYGGSNQHMSYPALPNFGASTAAGASGAKGEGTFSGWGNKPGQYFTTSPGGIHDLGGSQFTAPTMDPAFTNQFYSMLSQLMGGQGAGLQGNFLNFLTGQPSSTPGSSQLGHMAETGNPISALPEWQSMLEAQQRNIGENQANLKEQFAFAGDLQSSPFGNAMTDFMSQTTKDQNALLGQLQTSALENAQNRELSAGMGIQSLAGNESQFLNQLFASSALTSPQIFQKQHSSILGGLGSMLGMGAQVGGSIAEGLAGGGGAVDVLSSLAGLFMT